MKESIGGAAAADAYASPGVAGLGGWWLNDGCTTLEEAAWFRLEVQPEELPAWFEVPADLSKAIAFFELLAQVCLFVLRASGNHGAVFHHRCDNSPSVGAIARSFTTSKPLCWALQALAFYSSLFSSSLEVRHIAGKSNTWADKISRWRSYPVFMQGLDPEKEVKISLRELLQRVWQK